jgi:LEA14-like dessication related protein
MDENTADVEIALKIYNPNKWKITVKDLKLDASVNKKYVGVVNFDKKIVLPKKSEQTYLLVVKTDMAQVKKLIPSLMFSNQALVNLKGNIKVKARGISKRVNLDHDEKISRNDLKGLLMVKNNDLN